MLSVIPLAVLRVLTLHCSAVAKAGGISFCFSALWQETKRLAVKEI